MREERAAVCMFGVPRMCQFTAAFVNFLTIGVHLETYCGTEHQTQHWSVHKAACKQLVRQTNIHSKLKAILDRAFTITCYNYPDRPTPADADDLQPLATYRLTWMQDHAHGTNIFKWRALEGPTHCLPEGPAGSNVHAVSTHTSCSLYERASKMLEFDPPLLFDPQPPPSKEDTHVREGGIHALAEIKDQDTFYGFALNYLRFGTILPWAPCKCQDRSYADADASGEEERNTPQLPARGRIQRPPEGWLELRQWWDPMFARAKVRQYLYREGTQAVLLWCCLGESP